MSDGTKARRRGAKAVSDRDWLFGSRPRRRLLEGLLLGKSPQGPWGRAELAEFAGVVANGGLDEHLQGLARLGLIFHDGQIRRRWHAADPPVPLAEALARVLAALQVVPDAPPAQRESPPLGIARITRALQSAERAAVAASSELDPDTLDEILRLLGDARQRLRRSSVGD
jgi:hypothetical protein